MKILPFEKYTIESTKSPESIGEIIDKNCGSWKFPLFRQSNPMPLFGSRKGNNFKLYRYIQYRNSFLPIAFGKISNNQGGTVIEISLRMHWFVFVFMFFWLFFVSVAFFAFLFSPNHIAVLVPFGMFIVGYSLMYFCFWLEIPKLKNLISKMLENG